ncbi:MAG: formylglycine-generating enzyme family protein [Anaerolineales bacterium]|nr:formylglycine-generating enzyme family protein [Anaerolineales bacterium]
MESTELYLFGGICGFTHLPTEEEWEKGARGLDVRNFPWGEAEPNEKLCNFDRQAVSATPVGQYSPQGDSPYGCADMAGNVWEWCQSKKVTYPYKTSDRRNDEVGTDMRMLRGGSWGSDRDDVRSIYRDTNSPYHRDQYIGFRCARAAF